jgi:hypothetical protein
MHEGSIAIFTFQLLAHSQLHGLGEDCKVACALNATSTKFTFQLLARCYWVLNRRTVHGRKVQKAVAHPALRSMKRISYYLDIAQSVNTGINGLTFLNK